MFWWIITQSTILEDILLVVSVIWQNGKNTILGHEILVITLYFYRPRT